MREGQLVVITSGEFSLLALLTSIPIARSHVNG